MSKHAPSATKSRLDFINNEKNASFPCNSANLNTLNKHVSVATYLLKPWKRCWNYSTFALNGFENKG